MAVPLDLDPYAVHRLRVVSGDRRAVILDLNDWRTDGQLVVHRLVDAVLAEPVVSPWLRWVVIIGGALLIAILLVATWRSLGRGQLRGFAYASCLATLLLGGYFTFASLQALLLATRAEAFPADPPWSEAKAPAKPFDSEVLKSAVDELRILLLGPLVCDENMTRRPVLERFLKELPDRITQRESQTARQAEQAEPQDAGLGTLAQASPSGGDWVCLYVSPIRAAFQRAGVFGPEAEAAALAYLLLHEICHVRPYLGGFLEVPVPGDREGRTQHVGLHCWTAVVAGAIERSLGEADAEDDAHARAQLAGACFELRRANELLDPRAPNAYSDVYSEYRKTMGFSARFPGPTAWAPSPIPLVPARCGGS